MSVRSGGLGFHLGFAVTALGPCPSSEMWVSNIPASWDDFRDWMNTGTWPTGSAECMPVMILTPVTLGKLLTSLDPRMLHTFLTSCQWGNSAPLTRLARSVRPSITLGTQSSPAWVSARSASAATINLRSQLCTRSNLREKNHQKFNAEWRSSALLLFES